VIWSALRIAWRTSAALLLARAAVAVAMGALPAFAAWQLKAVLDGLGQAPLGRPVILLVTATALAAFLPEAGRYVDAQLHRAVGLAARRDLYLAVGSIAGLRPFEDPEFHDRLTLAAESGPNGPPAVVSSILGTVQGILTVAAFVVTLTALNPWLTLIVALAALPALRAELWLGRHRAKLLWDLGNASRREFFYAQLMTGVTAAKEVRLFGLSGLFGARMLTELRRINAGQRRMDRRELAVQAIQTLFGAAVMGAGLWWAVSQGLSAGEVAIFVAAIGGVQAGLIATITNLGQAHEALVLFGHYRHILGAAPDLPTGAGLPVPPLRDGIQLTDVWFRYGDGLPWVLRGVSLHIPAGAATALVGENGSGKSTLVKLLCRFYDPSRGTITWDGQDLRQFDPASLRQRIGVVFQDFMAYDLTAADNIGLGDVAHLGDRARITEAAQRAGCHDFLTALPSGYDTPLTRVFQDPADRDNPANGVILSGGQWQRVAFARALMRRDSDLLILDEPHSGLDATAEHETGLALREHRAGRTSILISHRLSAVRDAANLAVLAGGVVAEQGEHGQLVAAQGHYARLFSLQASGYLG
jgi:ATP-binding cassette subfamily B protein